MIAKLVEVELKVTVTMEVREELEPFDVLHALLMDSEGAASGLGFRVASVRPVHVPAEESYEQDGEGL